MTFKKFFRPSRGKLILPALLILIYLALIVFNYSLAFSIGPLFCEGFTQYLIPMKEALAVEDNATVEHLTSEYELFKLNNPVLDRKDDYEELNALFIKISPFYDNNYLTSYMKRADYECIVAANTGSLQYTDYTPLSLLPVSLTQSLLLL